MNFIISKEAERDILSIGRYTQHRWGPEQRKSYLSGLNQQFCMLAENPLAYRERHEFNPPVRICKYKHHLIVYMEAENGVLIVRVLHKRMAIDEGC